MNGSDDKLFLIKLEITIFLMKSKKIALNFEEADWERFKSSIDCTKSIHDHIITILMQHAQSKMVRQENGAQ